MHNRTVIGGGKDRDKLHQFRAFNTVLAISKTALSGTHHAVDFDKCAHRYLAEGQCRFNRRFHRPSILVRLVRAAVTARPRPVGVIRAAEAGR